MKPDGKDISERNMMLDTASAAVTIPILALHLKVITADC